MLEFRIQILIRKKTNKFTIIIYLTNTHHLIYTSLIKMQKHYFSFSLSDGSARYAFNWRSIYLVASSRESKKSDDDFWHDPLRIRGFQPSLEIPVKKGKERILSIRKNKHLTQNAWLSLTGTFCLFPFFYACHNRTSVENLTWPS